MPRKRPEDLDVTVNEPVFVEQNQETNNELSIPEKEYDVEISSSEGTTTKKIKLDLQVDATAKDLGPNPYMKWVHLADTIDAWRPFPRVFISMYIYLVYKVVIWYTELPDPSMEQSGLISVVVGAGAAWFGLYLGSGSRR